MIIYSLNGKLRFVPQYVVQRLHYLENCTAKRTRNAQIIVRNIARSNAQTMHETTHQTMCKPIPKPKRKPIPVFARDSALDLHRNDLLK